ncbi:MAG: glycosyltransferase family 4 protein [Bdellovibrionales bacterium]|nr:glycosyltransferase family 4 protein [Bdellovibrionales bacterium]
MQNREPISIMIHDLNPWGGQDRSMLEIAWQMNKEFPLEIHSYTLDGYQKWPNMKHVPYQTPIKKPILIKYLIYHIKSWLNLKKKPGKLVQSTGTASLCSDVVQVQFIHHAWQTWDAQLPKDKSNSGHFLKKMYHWFLKKYKLFLEKKVYTPKKKYIAISHTIKKELMDHFSIPEDNISIIYHGVDGQHFHPWQEDPKARNTRETLRKNLGIAPTEILLLHVGALNARKGIYKTLQTLALLKKQNFSNLKYLAVGGGDQKLIEQWIEEFDLKNEVMIASHSKDIRDYYWAADVFFFPTVYEPFGLVTLEAMACGLPVAVSNHAGSSELIEDGSNGVLFDPLDSEWEIAQKLNPLLKDAQYRQQLAERARVTAKEHSWESVGKQYINFYKKQY